MSAVSRVIKINSLIMVSDTIAAAVATKGAAVFNFS
jgi:hypothetical protein